MIRITAQGITGAELLAALHGRCFQPAWEPATIAALLSAAGGFAFVAEAAFAGSAPEMLPAGFVLFRVTAEEAEVLTIGVVPEARRSGVGRAVLDAALAEMRARGATKVFLEVAANNDAAIALYERAGFSAVGRRPAYYAVPGGRVDALVLCKRFS